MLRSMLLVPMVYLAGCPFPCPRGTHTNGGDQCLPRDTLGTLEFLVTIENTTAEKVDVRMRVSRRELNCPAIDAAHTPQVLGAALSPGGDVNSLPERSQYASHEVPPGGRHSPDLGWPCAAVRIWVGTASSFNVVMRRSDRYAIQRGGEPGSYILTSERVPAGAESAVPVPCPKVDGATLVPLTTVTADTTQWLELGDAPAPVCLLGDLLVEPTTLRLHRSQSEWSAVAPGTTLATTERLLRSPASYTVFGGMRVLVGARRENLASGPELREDRRYLWVLARPGPEPPGRRGAPTPVHRRSVPSPGSD